MSFRQLVPFIVALTAASVNLDRLQAQQYVRLSGVVTDLATGEPITGVAVVIGNRVVATTNSDGTFRVSTTLIVPGSNVVSFRRIGYGQTAKMWWVSADQTEMVLHVMLETLAVRLATIVVAEEPGARGKLRGFYERQRTTIGKFLGPDKLERARPVLSVTDFLRRVPGVLVRYGKIRFPRADPWCRGEFGLYVDGAWINTAMPLNLDDIVNHHDVTAIEVYSGAARVPLEYSRLDTNCGVILIWTR